MSDSDFYRSSSLELVKRPETILETATRLAVAVAPEALGKGASVGELAVKCVDLALALRDALTRPVVFPPTMEVIGECRVQGDGHVEANCYALTGADAWKVAPSLQDGEDWVIARHSALMNERAGVK